MNQFKEVAIPIVANADDLPFGSVADSFNQKKIVSIRTRDSGKTTGKKPVANSNVLKTMVLELKNHDNNTMGEVPLSYILAWTENQEGRGLSVNDKIAFADSKIKCLDPTVLITGECVALLFEFEK